MIKGVSYMYGLEPLVPGCIAIVKDDHELAVALADSFKRFDMHSVKFVETYRDGKLVTVREEELKQEELLDRTYSEIVHVLDGVYYTWFVITFSDKLRGE